MKIKTTREGDIIDTNYLVVLIGDNTYRISENENKELEINKVSDTLTSAINIHPCTSNQIRLS